MTVEGFKAANFQEVLIETSSLSRDDLRAHSMQRIAVLLLASHLPNQTSIYPTSRKISATE